MVKKTELKVGKPRQIEKINSPAGGKAGEHKTLIVL